MSQNGNHVITRDALVQPPLDIDACNPKVIAAEYAVRGAIAIKAQDYKKQLANGQKLPFDKVLACNIGKLSNTYSMCYDGLHNDRMESNHRVFAHMQVETCLNNLSRGEAL